MDRMAEIPQSMFSDVFAWIFNVCLDLNQIYLVSILIYCSLVDDKSELVQVTAWYQTANKTLPESKFTQGTAT